MSRQILVAFLETVVLFDEMQVLATDGECALHLCGLDYSGKDTATDADCGRSEWAFFVNVCALDSFAGGFEAEANVL
jgi:hypothetical protein